jgi:hypothetical protein
LVGRRTLDSDGGGSSPLPPAIKTVTIPLDELENLKRKNRQQARQIELLTTKMREKTLDLDALTFVWCTGGCPGGVHRFSDTRLTEEMIQRAERNVQRMRSWYNTVKWRLTSMPTQSEWHKKYYRAIAAHKTDLVQSDTPL